MIKRSIENFGIFATLAATALGVVACGTREEAPEKKSAQPEASAPASEEANLSDSQVSGAAVEEVLEESALVVDQVDELGSDSEPQTGLMLAEDSAGQIKANARNGRFSSAASVRGALHSRSCLEDEAAGQTTVEIYRGVAKVSAFASAPVDAARSFGAQEYIKRVWSQKNASIDCNSEKTAALVDWSNVDGLKLAVEFKRGLAGSAGYKVAFTDKSAAIKGGVLAEGTRQIEFAQELLPEGLKKSATITSSVTREFKSKTLKGEQKSLTLSLKTADGKPMLVSSLENAESGELLSRSIVSGTLIATGKDGAKIETSFANVVYVKGDNCLRPQSGVVSGTITNSKGEVKNFQATYTPENAVIQLPNGETKTNPHACELNK